MYNNESVQVEHIVIIKVIDETYYKHNIHVISLHKESLLNLVRYPKNSGRDPVRSLLAVCWYAYMYSNGALRIEHIMMARSMLVLIHKIGTHVNS